MARERLYGVEITAAVESLRGGDLLLAKDYYRRAAKKILSAGYIIETVSLRGLPPEKAEILIYSLAESALTDDLAWLDGQGKYRRRLRALLSTGARHQPMVITEGPTRSDELPLEPARQKVQTEREITLTKDSIITAARACGVYIDTDHLDGESGSISRCTRLLYDAMDSRSEQMRMWCGCWVDLLLHLLSDASSRDLEPTHPAVHGMVSALRVTIDRVMTIWGTLGAWKD